MPTNKTAPLRERILEQIPGYAAATNRERALRLLSLQGVDTVGNRTDIDTDFADRIARAVDAGTTDLTELRADYAAAITGLEARSSFHRLAIDVMQRARDDANQLLADHADVALDYLRGKLDQLFADVAKNRTAIEQHPDSAEAAITAGATTGWTLVNELLGRYDEIRKEHRAWVIRQSGAPGTPGFATIGQARRFLEIDPGWLHRRAAATPPTQDDTLAAWFRKTAAVEPSDVNRTTIWPATYRPSNWLLTVADNDPWLPDADTIAECHTLADELFRTAGTASPSWTLSRLAILAEHGAITELTPANT